MLDALTVYISSTFDDLREHRAAVGDGIRRAGFQPIMMEAFGATSEIVVDACRSAIERSDVMVLLVAHRYGAGPSSQGLSYTEFEYNAARAAAKPVLAFILADDYPWPPNSTDSGDARERLDSFKARVRSELVIEKFTSPSDLELRVTRAIIRFAERIGRTERHEGEANVASTNVGARTLLDTAELLSRIENRLEVLAFTVTQLQTHIESPPSVGSKADRAIVRQADFLGPMADEIEADLCFVAMPYSKSWSKALAGTLADICRDAGFRILIAKDMNGRFIPHDIWRGITAAKVIVADITDANPNVAYEIGLADVLGREIILLCQGKEVPFDFLGQRLICYEDTMAGGIALREGLTARLREVKNKRQ